MNVLAVSPDQHPDMVCTVVGLGLLGSAVAKRFRRYVECVNTPPEGLHLDWTAPKMASCSLLHLLRLRHARQVELIWCAGQAGFLSRNDEMEAEFDFFEEVVSTLHAEFTSGLTINLLSSAGGLYEGSGVVRHINEIETIRPYGAWKLKQELFLSQASITARIFRLSSAYGPLQASQRTGMLNVLLERAHDGGVAEVYASPVTLRDYVFTDDIAKYVVDGILEQRDSTTRILASGRSTSVDSLIKLITSATNKRIRVQYRNLKQNTTDIVFPKHLLPGDFAVSPLEETVRLLAARRLGGIDNQMVRTSR